MKKIVKSILLSRYFTLSKYFSLGVSNVVGFYKNKANKDTINFIVTSKTEIRVFSPILNYILTSGLDIIINVFFTNQNLKLDDQLFFKLEKDDRFKLNNNPIKLTDNRKNSINVICLDHEKYSKKHFIGIELVKYFNKLKIKTVCIQHGGNQNDYIEGQLSSVSKFQIVFGKRIFNFIKEKLKNTKKVYITGNPLHDNLFFNKSQVNKTNKKRLIALISCMHTEYDDYENSQKLYLEYVKKIYESVNFNDAKLIVKMHPYDSTDNNIYELVRNNLNLTKNEVEIIGFTGNLQQTYDLILKSDLIISRASTIIEESLMLNRQVIAFDLFEKGVSRHYDFLSKYSEYSKIINSSSELKKEIVRKLALTNNNKYINEKIVSDLTYRFDGKSSSRLVEALIDILKC
ncbi:hypothetical protein PK35_05910 [Tamlana nanhaiensis]|uniref:UDP-N-acetylglucosamine 2-epimerase domain-containing protein n=1 Tax=Neotamlana nanhaiensis TaxID=1382798 RepID=A0A0D7W6G1_9FLAO|nr:UDP-N-acetylglucosamine 2-epimerase [Tamlana nanhaiensis]KJD33392.1 hypothetical protein PK35_05910 [Tamlana nanhaiensis]